MKTVLITGATGFIGSHLAEALCQKNIRVRCIARPTSNLHWIQHLHVEIVHADLNNPDSLVKPAQESDVIFHLAGATKALDQQTFQESNVIATRNLLKAALSSPRLKRFVFVSSQAASGPSRNGIPVVEADTPHPLTRYGKSKLEAEHAVLSYSDRLPVTIIRPPSVFGPRDRDMFQIFKAVQFGFKPVLGRKPHYASFIFVEELVNGLIKAAESGQTIGKTYFLATEQKISWDEFNNAVADVTGKRAVKLPVPLWLFTLIAVIRDASSRITKKPDIINLDKVKEFRERFWICDSCQAEKDFNFHRSIDFETALEKTYKWYREQGWL